MKTGDLVQVKPGAKIPTDGVITAGTTTVNEAMVTGESMPITKQVGDSVIGTTINGNGSITVRVTKTGDETVLAQIVAMVKKAQTSHAPIQKLTDKIASIFVPAVLIDRPSFWLRLRVDNERQALDQSPLLTGT